MTRIGIIGTGILGNAVGLHLLNSGYTLTVFNRTKNKTHELSKHNAVVAESPKVVASNSDLVFTIVKDAKAVKEVSFGRNGIVEGKHDGLVVADMSTIMSTPAAILSATFLHSSIVLPGAI